ncbi:hypothetical protein J2X56_001193 [Herbaspirillum sp. 1173]|uniref:hypothetical protein n=1 Tax=Herbaspirillum sp. 1173 TaxID=2817734 RepID=UPI002859EB01|nr:hypothetical protein [Herbaspirillum sp. 1173]MDR6739207.1 hypothetical protein [Herbaspirillum sp. 1173]
MSTEYLKEIVGRHFLIILKIATKAADGEVFGDLVRKQVRKCLIEMHAAGAEPEDIRDIFGNLESCAQIASLVLEPKFLPLLKMVRLHVEFLLFIEENDSSNSDVKKHIG